MTAARSLLAFGHFNRARRHQLSNVAQESAFELHLEEDAESASAWLTDHQPQAILIDGERSDAAQIALDARIQSSTARTPILSRVEDVTDLVMAAALEHPELHPTVAEVSRIHRVEESRHMEFMREVILERYTRAGAVERAAMRVAAPMLALLVFTLLVSPRVYERSGVAGGTWASWRLWMRATRSPSRARLRASSVARMRRWLDQHGLVEGIASRIWAWAG